nr:unnamed protein product [Callosobruchus chinensis]
MKDAINAVEISARDSYCSLLTDRKPNVVQLKSYKKSIEVLCRYLHLPFSLLKRSGEANPIWPPLCRLNSAWIAAPGALTNNSAFVNLLLALGPHSIGSDDEKKLYIRLPVRIEDEFVVKDLHPDIVQVQLPRQKSRRWCIISFESKEKCQAARNCLAKLKIDNKKIFIKPFKRGVKKDSVKEVKSSKPLVKLLKK